MNRTCVFSLPLVALLLLCLGLSSCQSPTSSVLPRPGNRYATGFLLRDSADGVIAEVFSPWDKQTIMASYFIPSSRPYTNPAVTSCTHVGFLSALALSDSIVAACNPSLIYTPLTTSPYVSSPFFDLGEATQPSIENIILSSPDIIAVSTYSPSDHSADVLRQAGIPILYVNEWQECHPLARAEWIRFFGAIMGRMEMADSIFARVVETYNNLCGEVQSIPMEERPWVCSGENFRGTWYVPGGKTFMATFFRDAGARYRYDETENTASIPLSLEQAVRDFSNADVWVGINSRTGKELLAQDTKYEWFKAFQSHRVYHFLRRSTAKGANDFWERGVVHPEEVLRDFIRIFSSVSSADSVLSGEATVSSDTLMYMSVLR